MSHAASLPNIPSRRGAHARVPRWFATYARQAILALVLVATQASAPRAEEPHVKPPAGWESNLNLLESIAPADSTTTVTKQKPPEPRDAMGMAADGRSQIRLVALLTADGQRIDKDIVWRLFEPSTNPGTPGKLVQTLRDGSPTVRLAPGTYVVNAAFGRAHITRKITVGTGVETTEPFVLNAGGLRVQVGGSSKLDASKVHYEILSDERDQSGSRSSVMSRARPGIVVRLNSGIYRIVSTYGDANATVDSDITVEAGKLTEVTVTHRPARVTLKLVTRQGGEALPDTNWTLLTMDGRTVKESVGALPTHFIAPGSYLAVAKSQGNVFRREFAVRADEVTEVEVVRQ